MQITKHGMGSIFCTAPTPTFFDKCNNFLRRTTQIEIAQISKVRHVLVYQPGKATDDDLRQKIIHDIVEHGGSFFTGFFSGKNFGNHNPNPNPNPNVTCFAKQLSNLFHRIVFHLIYVRNFGETSKKKPVTLLS